MEEYNTALNENAQQQTDLSPRPPKKKLKKWQKVIIAIVSVAVSLAVLFFVAVTIYTVIDMKKSRDYVPAVLPIEERSLDLPTGEDDFVDGEITVTPIVFGDGALAEFEKYLSENEPEYAYSELYNLDAALERYHSANTVHIEKHKYDVRVNGVLDPDALYRRVLENNDAYFEDSSHIKGFYDIPSKKEIKELCEWICRVVPEYVARYPQIDIDAVCCNLYNLKIMSNISKFSNADINSEMVFNYDKKQMEVNKFAMNTDDIYTTVFYHEMAHLCQFCCDCYDDYEEEWRVGINHYYHDLEINPLMWSWFVEGSAERIMARQLNVELTTYRNYVGYLTSLEYILQLGGDAAALDLEELTFERETDKIFEAFSLKTDEQKLEFIKMMYTIEAFQNLPDGFADAYEAKTGENLSDDKVKETYRLNVKQDAIESMTRLFYRNLARRINGGDVTLEDCYYLIRLWESKVCHHYSITTYGYMAFFSDAYKRYLAVQDEFFALLAAENGMSAEDIDDGFQNYHIKIRQGETEKNPNCSLNFFTEQEKAFVREFYSTYYRCGFPSIKKCVDYARQCKADIEQYNSSQAQQEQSTAQPEDNDSLSTTAPEGGAD